MTPPLTLTNASELRVNSEETISSSTGNDGLEGTLTGYKGKTVDIQPQVRSISANYGITGKPSSETNGNSSALNQNDPSNYDNGPASAPLKGGPASRNFRYSLQSVTSQTSSDFNYEEVDNISAVVDSSSPAAAKPVETPSPESKRFKVMSEIVETEVRYCADLAFIKNFKDPLLALVGTPNEIIHKRTIQDIFFHYESILAVNLELKSQLEARLDLWKSTNFDQVGDIFLSLSPFLRVYSLFLSNFNHSTVIVKDLLKSNIKFSEFIKTVEMLPESRNLTLNAFLMTPVQRIPRYKMLLEDLFKRTAPDHADYKNLQTSIKLITEIASFVNEHIRDQEMMQMMFTLQKSIQGLKEDLLVPGRRFLKRGNVLKISRRSNQGRELLLFTDILLYASQGRLEEGSLLCHRSIPLNGLSIYDIPDSDDFKNIFQLVTRDKSFAVLTESAKEKEEWIAAITKAIHETNDRGTIKKEKNPSSAPLPDFHAPVWMPDNQAKQCPICSMEFSFLLRRHHCRFCGIVVCHPCSRNSFFVPVVDEEPKPSRVCDKCFPVIVQKQTFKIVVAPISPMLDFNEDRSSIDSTRPSFELSSRLSTDTMYRDSIRRDSIDSRASMDTTRSSFDVNRIFFNRRGVAAASRLDISSIYNRLAGRPRPNLASQVCGISTSSSCSLCLNPFSMYSWKHQCTQCDRPVCRSCCSKSSKSTVCDPCARCVDPRDVIVNPNGFEWGARFALSS